MFFILNEYLYEYKYEVMNPDGRYFGEFKIELSEKL